MRAALDALDAETVDVQVDIDADTDRLDTVKSKLDQVESSGRAGGTAISGIGGSISELPGVGALGPIAESLGQLTENALEGGESIKGIGSALGVLGGTAAVMWGIQKAMQSIADTDAFNEEQAEAFRTALEEVKDEAQAVLDVIEQAGGVKGRAGGLFGMFEGTKDITAELLEAKVGADEFITAVTEGGPALDTVVGKLTAMRDALKEQQEQSLNNIEKYDEVTRKVDAFDDAIEITKETLKNYTTEQKGSAEMAEFLATATGTATDETKRSSTALVQASIDAAKHARALDDATTSTEELEGRERQTPRRSRQA